MSAKRVLPLVAESSEAEFLARQTGINIDRQTGANAGEPFIL